MKHLVQIHYSIKAIWDEGPIHTIDFNHFSQTQMISLVAREYSTIDVDIN